MIRKEVDEKDWCRHEERRKKESGPNVHQFLFCFCFFLWF
jgi:hypothetical protein